MSLDKNQRSITTNEFNQSLAQLHLTVAELSEFFQVTSDKIQSIIDMDERLPENVWILRNNLLERFKEQNITPIYFSQLQGDYHNYWFLDSQLIDRKILL